MELYKESSERRSSEGGGSTEGGKSLAIGVSAVGFVRLFGHFGNADRGDWLLFRLGADTAPNQPSVNSHLAVLELVQIVRPGPLRHLGHDVVQDLELALGKDVIERLAHANHHHQHQREEDRGDRERFDQPQHGKACQLYHGEQMHPPNGDLRRNEKFEQRTKDG